MHDEYQNKIGKAVGQVEKGESAKQAQARVEGALTSELKQRFTQHEPRSGWEQTLKDEGRSMDQVNTMYRQEKLQYRAPMMTTRAAQSQAPAEPPPLSKVNPFGAPQSSPFDDGDSGGGDGGIIALHRYIP